MRPIATLRWLPVVVVAVTSACSMFNRSLSSVTSIDAGQAFRLGGGQPGAFVVRGSNTGPVEVVVFSDLRGTRDSIATLAPGARVDAEFPKGATAIFMNTSATRSASVSIKVTGNIAALSMGYERSPKR